MNCESFHVLKFKTSLPFWAPLLLKRFWALPMDEGSDCSNSSDDGLNLPVWANLLLVCLLVVGSGLFSGLTLGLLSLDKNGLQVLIDAGDDTEKEHAKKIAPVRENGNLLLCTLLIGNTIVNAFLAILLAGLTTGVFGLLISTTLIVILGEIVPQSICSRHGLFVGANTIWITRFWMFVLYPAAKPIASILDCALGEEIGTVYSRKELQRLIEMHVEDPEAQKESGLTKDDHNILTGALQYREKRVSDVMTTLDKVFMLDSSVRLSFVNMLEIYKSGYTRIPVYERVRENIIGILYVKDLILVDPDDEVEVSKVITFHRGKPIRYILDSTYLNDVFKQLKEGGEHMMIACRAHDQAALEKLSTAPRSLWQQLLHHTEKEITGLITLEDVLEEVIQGEIVDETDVFYSNEQTHRIRGKGRERADIAQFLAMFDHKIREQSKLSREEMQAVVAFLNSVVPEFKQLNSMKVLKGMLRLAEVEDIDGSLNDEPINTPSCQPGEYVDGQMVLYKKGEPSDMFTLILQGRVLVRAGNEDFPSELGPWSYLATAALVQEHYVPDYSAVSTGPCRLVRMSRSTYQGAVQCAKAADAYGDMAMTKLAQHRLSANDVSAGSSIPVLRHPPAPTLLLPQPSRRSLAAGPAPSTPAGVDGVVPRLLDSQRAGGHAGNGLLSVVSTPPLPSEVALADVATDLLASTRSLGALQDRAPTAEMACASAEDGERHGLLPPHLLPWVPPPVRGPFRSAPHHAAASSSRAYAAADSSDPGSRHLALSSRPYTNRLWLQSTRSAGAAEDGDDAVNSALMEMVQRVERTETPRSDDLSAGSSCASSPFRGTRFPGIGPGSRSISQAQPLLDRKASSSSIDTQGAVQ